MAIFLPGSQCSRFHRALLLSLLLVVLLVGQSHVALGNDAAVANDGVQRTVAVDAFGEMEVVDSLPQKGAQRQQVRRDLSSSRDNSRTSEKVGTAAPERRVSAGLPSGLSVELYVYSSFFYINNSSTRYTDSST